jgi:hypothetical protein
VPRVFAKLRDINDYSNFISINFAIFKSHDFNLSHILYAYDLVIVSLRFMIREASNFDGRLYLEC